MEKYYYLNELERDALIRLNQDEITKQAIMKVLLEGIYAVGVLNAGEPADKRNWAYNLGGLNDFAMDDDKVGNLLKITTRAFAIVEDGFKKLEDFKSEDVSEEQENPAK